MQSGDRRIMAITSAFQADDVGSIPIGRSLSLAGRETAGGAPRLPIGRSLSLAGRETAGGAPRLPIGRSLSLKAAR